MHSTRDRLPRAAQRGITQNATVGLRSLAPGCLRRRGSLLSDGPAGWVWLCTLRRVAAFRRHLNTVTRMKRNSTLTSLTRTLGSLPVAAAAASNLFGWGSRRRSRGTTIRAYLIGGGVLAGAAAALLLNPWNGGDLRSRVGKLFGGGLGKLVGEQVGAHPVGAAKAMRKAQDLLDANERA